jgi:hypothetical protein
MNGYTKPTIEDSKNYNKINLESLRKTIEEYKKASKKLYKTSKELAFMLFVATDGIERLNNNLKEDGNNKCIK